MGLGPQPNVVRHAHRVRPFVNCPLWALVLSGPCSAGCGVREREEGCLGAARKAKRTPWQRSKPPPRRCHRSVLVARVVLCCCDLSVGGCRPVPQQAMTFSSFNGIGLCEAILLASLSWGWIREGVYSVLSSWLLPLLDKTEAA